MHVNKVYVKSLHVVTPGRHYSKSFRDLAAEAFLKAWEDAGCPDIDMIVLASAVVDIVEEQLLSPSYICEYLSLESTPFVRIEVGDASGTAALAYAYHLVKCGVCRNIAVIGVEKITDFTSVKVNKVLSYLCDSAHESYYGITPAVHAALMTRSYMRKFGYRYEDIAWWSVKMHERGASNPYASLRRRLKIEDILSSEVVADPIRLFDTAVPVDGAVCIILSSEKSDLAVELAHAEQRACNVSLNIRSDPARLLTVSALRETVRKFAPTIFEISDKFSIFGVLIIEELGLAKPGTAPRLVKDGTFDPGSKIVVNASGGLKCIGYPVGASGLYLSAMLVMELARMEPFRNVGDHVVGAVCDVGGVDRLSNVLIFRRGS